MSHETLANYYQTNFSLMHQHHYSLTEIEDMLPWERVVYIGLLNQHLEKEKQEAQSGGN
jgi:hypothetical protein